MERRTAALAEAGDIILAITERAIGDRPHRRRPHRPGARPRHAGPEQITVFKSVGIADEDLVLVRLIARRMTGGA